MKRRTFWHNSHLSQEVPMRQSKFTDTARIGRAPFHRARSASKKDGLAAPLSPC